MADDFELITGHDDALVGDVITHGDKKLKVVSLYVQGGDAKQSGYKYFIQVPRGVLGLKEV